MNKKLIEVAIPLDAINEASAREKSIRQGHPSTLHLWWARRPLATARAVIFASLVDDPSSHPELFPTEKEQNAERTRLFNIIQKLVEWNNSDNKTVLDAAMIEIKKYNNNEITLLDPFSGGGSIPIEAQRLGIKAIANDLNPVAITIEKAIIEIPSIFKDNNPINPRSNTMSKKNWYSGAEGLSEDITYYGNKLKELAVEELGYLYPDYEEGMNRKVIAWSWCRKTTCNNPACQCEIPLYKSCYFTNRKGKECYAKPVYEGNKVSFVITEGNPEMEGTITTKGAICPKCGQITPIQTIIESSKNKKLGTVPMGIIVDGNPGRMYCNIPESHKEILDQKIPDDAPHGEMVDNPRDIHTKRFGLTDFNMLFTGRQMIMLTKLIELIDKIKDVVYNDALKIGMNDDDTPLYKYGKGARAYSEAIAVYLTIIVDKLVDYHSMMCTWHKSKELIRNTFGRQAILMSWDFVEANPFSNSTGCISNAIEWVSKTISKIVINNEGYAYQHNSMDFDETIKNVMISTDPPYYDNIAYADLSDYFYIWMRKSLKNIYPDIFSTMLVPKKDELVAISSHFNDNKTEAKQFFETGMKKTFDNIYRYTSDNIPVTIYYAFKQSESEGSDAAISSKGWETILSAIISSGFQITGTWPMRTEMINRNVANGTNALASSIVLVCRKRTENKTCSRREFINELRKELKPAIINLQKTNIAPVDLAQSSIGPGIAVYSKYESILETNGEVMTVRTALQIINQELDSIISEQEGEMDSESRFCVNLFSQYAYNNVSFGEADVLARAKNTSVERLSNLGLVSSEKGYVRLKSREELPEPSKTGAKAWLLCQQLTREVERGGIEPTAKILIMYPGNEAENAKSLAYRLFSIADQKKWTQEAYAYNSLITAWPEIQSTLMTLIGHEGKTGTTTLDRWAQ